MNSVVSLAEWLNDQIGDDKPYATNVDLAKAAGLSEGTIRRLIAGHEPSLSTLRKLANGLKYPIAELQKMAGILEDDEEVQDDLTNYIKQGVKDLPEDDKLAVWALVQQLLKNQTK